MQLLCCCALRHTAAGPRLRLLFFYWLFQFEEGWVTAGWRVVNCAAVGGDQRHAGIVRVDFGIGERVRGAVTQVTVEQRVIQQFGGGPLFLELWQSLSTLSWPDFLLGALGGDNLAFIRRRWAAIEGWLRRHGRRCGDEAVRFAAAFFEDGGQLGFVWQLHIYNWLDLQNINTDYFNPSIRLFLWFSFRLFNTQTPLCRSCFFDQRDVKPIYLIRERRNV